MKNNDLLRLEATELIKKHIECDRINNERNFGHTFSFHLFNCSFDWGSEIFYLKDTLKEIIKLISHKPVIELAEQKKIGIDDAAEHLFRLINFLDELKSNWSDNMELYCVLNQQMSDKRLLYLIDEYKVKLKQQALECSLKANTHTGSN